MNEQTRKVISVHEYILKEGVDPQTFERALREARESGLLDLPGLLEVYFVKGIRGAREGQYAAIWVYESREAWERLWGAPGRPVPRERYPANWRTWEDEILAPFLAEDPDAIRFTSYQEV
ncbi:MAG: hypothetical protein D6770_11345 [Anaerolineae bacterium]|nr:MAG: hypothetical protein D6770_11345 [Anaerolineae bacterium]